MPGTSTVVIAIFDPDVSDATDPSEALADIYDRLYVRPVFARADGRLGEGDAEAFYAHTGQLLSDGVLGCALAHRDALQRLLDMACEWAVVLEDDAVITDVERFVSVTRSFAESFPDDEAAVLQLYWPPEHTRLADHAGRVVGVHRCGAMPPATVAYLINRRAADIVVSRQTPVAFQADWPFTATEVCAYVDTHAPVQHGGGVSLVDRLGRQQGYRPRAWHLRLFSGAWYLQYRRYFPNWAFYQDLLLRPRVLKYRAIVRRGVLQRTAVASLGFTPRR